ncbi:MAG: hypothetical protein IIB66_13540 [Proteobacteria bacterium]|nr:hypothetical protein [Pseudomonadota bacterium]MCH8189694.1 hypothetical protein [Pseudomonadota bacterium]
MAITFMDIARESLRPIRQALGAARPRAEDSRYADLVRAVEARGDDGIGTPIAASEAAVGRRFDFHV